MSQVADVKQFMNPNISEDEIRNYFPIFSNQPELIFFDNASTSQKPAKVISTIEEFYSSYCSNVGRASYRFATFNQNGIEKSRTSIANLIHANSIDLVFTSGATDSLNMVALCWGMHNLRSGDQIMVCFQDHKSAVLPWLNLQRILRDFDIYIDIVPYEVRANGDYDLKSIRTNFNSKTRLLAMCHIHHVFGIEMEIDEIRQTLPDDVLISLDASQSIGHIEVNAEKLNVDFISFSGHKMFAGNGVGALWVNPKIQSLMKPIKLGGSSAGAINQNGKLEINGSKFRDKFEAGTLNIPAILSLQPAVELIEYFGINFIQKRVVNLSRYLYDFLNEIPGIEFAPGAGFCGCLNGCGIISFRLEQASSTDLAFLLDSENIFVRSGDHCLSRRNSQEDYLRVSMHFYNTKAEIDRFIQVIKKNVV